jgi:hypothetical protein
MRSFNLKFKIEEVNECCMCYCIYLNQQGEEKELISQGRTEEESLQTMFTTLKAKLQSDSKSNRLLFLRG